MNNATTTNTPVVADHKWNQLGYVAPFRVITVIEIPGKNIMEANPMAAQQQLAEAHRIAASFGIRGLGCCNVCGAGLKYNYVIQDANGTYFIVGSSCVRKSGNTKLISQIEADLKERRRKQREAKREEKRLALEAKYAAAEEAQRQRNGGKTDLEIVRENEAAEQQKIESDNQWIIHVLKYTNGNFAADMAHELKTKYPRDLSGRQLQIVRDIFAKSAGRRGSNAFESALDDFDNRV